MTTKIDLLDHGYVRLVSYMQPVPDSMHMMRDPRWTGDLEVVRNARVSYNAAWRTGENEKKDAGLIRYMSENEHTTPFEAMVFTFEIVVPIFVTRQWHRHRTWSYNEWSARFTELEEVFYIPDPEVIGVPSAENKQARDVEINEDMIEASMLHLRGVQANDLLVEMEHDYEIYMELLKSGWPRELARIKLPVGIYTTFFGTVDLHNLFHFCMLRMDPHAQWEIQQYARALYQLIEPICPVACSEFQERFEETQAIKMLRAVCKKSGRRLVHALDDAVEEEERQISEA